MEKYRNDFESYNPEMIDFEGFDDMPRSAPRRPAQPLEPPYDDEPEIPYELGDLDPAPQPAPKPRPTAKPKASAPAKPKAAKKAAKTPAAEKPKDANVQMRKRARKPTVIISLLVDLRSRIFLGIVLAVATLYILVVSISYFANVLHDQNEVLSSTLVQLGENPEAVRNAGGPLGAWVSEIIINKWLGLGTFVLVYWLAMCSLGLLGVRRLRFEALTFKCLLCAISISLILGYVTFNSSMPFYLGGAHGYYVIAKADSFAGHWGALGIAVIAVAMLALLFMDTLAKLGRRLSRLWRYQRIRSTRSQIHARQRRARQEEREAREAAEREARERQEKNEDDSPLTEAEKEPVEKFVPQETFEVTESVPTLGGISTIGSIQVTIPTPDPDMEVEVPSIEAADNPHDSVAQQPPTPLIQPKEDPEEEEEFDSDLYDPRADLSLYRFPTLDLLREPTDSGPSVDATELESNKQRITKTLLDYGIPIASIKATVGPTVTLYEIVPAEGIRVSKIKHLEDDIAMSLAALGIRIIAPIPGKGTIGIEVPNHDPKTVSIRSILGSKAFCDTSMELPMALGCTIQNEVFIADLTKMPHLLVAGATGMGKSVGLNTIIASLLYKKHPAELKFVLVDPKMVEFSLYSTLERHFLAKLPDEEEAIITNPAKVVATLNSLCIEMDNRYTLLKNAGCRSIKEYNEKFTRRRLNPEKGHRFLPYIVVIVDEFADLIMTAGKEVETPIARIAQKARAVGIHMILATQRPSTNVITGVIKANFPGRIAFRVFQMVDSRTIIDRPGANQLIGRGDMLFSNSGKIERVQCAFIDTPEVEEICSFIEGQQGYPYAYELPEYVPEDSEGGHVGSVNDKDSLFEECARYVVTSGTASTSNLQRRYSIGYNRAGKIMDQLEMAGIVSAANGSKPRQVLIDSISLEHMLESM